MGAWRDIFTAEQRKLPRTATPQERAEATRRASRIYHGLAPRRPRRRNPTGRAARRNPGGPGLLTLGLIGVGGWLLYSKLSKPQG